jgi:hypothetical protein
VVAVPPVSLSTEMRGKGAEAAPPAPQALPPVAPSGQAKVGKQLKPAQSSMAEVGAPTAVWCPHLWVNSWVPEDLLPMSTLGYVTFSRVPVPLTV